MSQLTNLQRSIRQRGRIRIGYSTPGKRADVKVPHKLDRFRFTAADRAVIDAVAALYGGEPEPWRDEGRDEWQVTTDARSIPILLPPGAMALSQSWDQWAKGFHVRTCDGTTSRVPGNPKVEDCQCDPDAPNCQLSTHLSVILPEVPGLGTWRLTSHGWYAATELAGSVGLLEELLGGTGVVPARLGLDRREVRRLIDGKPQVRKYVVPTIDVDQTVTALVGARGALTPTADKLPATPVELPSAPGGWRPVDPAALPEAPGGHIDDQLGRAKPTPKRSGPPVKSTGRPRGGGSDDKVCDRCSKPYGTETVVRNPTPGGSRYVHQRCLGETPEVTETDTDDDDEGEGKRRPMTYGKQAALHATAAEAFPDASDEERRAHLLAMAEVLGVPGLTSRSQIDDGLGSELIDVLAAIRDGDLVWDGGGFTQIGVDG